jgi:hypothetical protein
MLEPIIFLFASFLLTASMRSVASKMIKSRLEQFFPFAVVNTLFRSLWIQDDTVFDKSSFSIWQMWSLYQSSLLGATATLTGSMSNIVVLTAMYDGFGYLDFFSNMLLPVAFSLAVVHAVGYVLHIASKNSSKGESAGITTSSVSNEGKNLVGEIVGLGEMPDPENECDEKCPLEESLDSSKSGCFNVLRRVLLVLMFLLLAFDCDILIVSLSSALCFVFVENWDRHYENSAKGSTGPVRRDNCEPPTAHTSSEAKTPVRDFLSEVDYKQLVYWMAQFIIVGALNDTGLPGQFFSVALGNCADSPFYGLCLAKSASVLWLVFLAVSPVSGILMMAAIFPFLSPYQWIHVAWIASMASRPDLFVNSVVENAQPLQTVSKWKHTLLNVLLSLICMYGGIALISVVNFSPDCSIKLGECDTGN